MMKARRRMEAVAEVVRIHQMGRLLLLKMVKARDLMLLLLKMEGQTTWKHPAAGQLEGGRRRRRRGGCMLEDARRRAAGRVGPHRRKRGHHHLLVVLLLLLSELLLMRRRELLLVHGGRRLLMLLGRRPTTGHDVARAVGQGHDVGGVGQDADALLLLMKRRERRGRVVVVLVAHLGRVGGSREGTNL